MAQAIVGYAVKKLGDLIEKEVQLLGGVGDEVRRMQKNLKTIQCYLEDADSKRHRGDKRVEDWLNDLRDVAYRIEDATDTFYVEHDQDHNHIEKSVEDDMNNNSLQKNYCCIFFHKVEKMGCKAKDLPSLHKLGKELGNIQKELDEIFERKDKFDIKPHLDDGVECRGSDQQRQLTPMINRRLDYQHVDETEIVGLNAHKDKILQLLDSPQRRAVITIAGAGGLGKTTLARLVYDSVKADFGYHIMLPVSQQFDLNYLTDLLKKLLRNLMDSVPEDEVEGYYVNKLESLLSGKRYLIVLDDVWHEALWGRLKHALPDDQNKSRVLITSRSIDVAESADPRMKPYNLDKLNDDESLNLLLKKALLYQEPDQDLLKIAKQLSKKCKGLPLALIVLGSILSKKDQTYNDWKLVFDTMDWFEEYANECMQVIAMSYEDMAHNLKLFFLYLAIFPENYEINAKRLLRMLVSEGFIPHKETPKEATLEQTAEKYLKQLFQRSMIMVSSRYTNGSIKYFRVHDLVRELAMSEARKQNFVTVFPEAARGVVNNGRDTDGTRRASLQCLDDIDNSREYLKWVGPNTRSLLWFSGWGNQQQQHCGERVELRLLRVVEIMGHSDIELEVVQRLIHLKYLAVKFRELILPSDFCWGRLKNLETLDIRSSYVDAAKMKSLWTIGTLRHVILPNVNNIDGPPANADLRNLQTLSWVCIPETWCNNKNLLPRLNNLRKIKLYLCNESVVDGLARLLGTLLHLHSLSIVSFDNHIPKEIVYPSGLPNYENLQTLYLEGPWHEGVRTKLEARFFPPHLLSLTLWHSKLEQDPMPELGKLKALKKLVLKRDVYSGGEEMEMICPAGGFPVLQTLRLVNLGIKSVTIMEGAMPKLKHLQHRNSLYPTTCLNLPPEHRHLAN